MFDIITGIINSGNFELADIIHKINILWLQSEITENEKDSLIRSAREKAKPENSYAPLEKQIEEAFKKISKLEESIDKVGKLETGKPTDPALEPEEYPEYKQPLGAHDAYNTGDKVTFKGKKYECIKDNCVWDSETYPDGWKIVS
jgi:hypothetical protein